MTTIHMETEKVYAVAKKLETDGAQMLSNLGRLQSSASRLNYAWQGGNSEQFNHEMNGLVKKLENQIMALQTLSVRVAREAEEWEMADRGTSSPGRGSSNYYSAMPGSSSNPSEDPLKRFILGPMKNGLEVVKDVTDGYKYVDSAQSFVKMWTHLMPKGVLWGQGLPIAGFTSVSALSATVFQRNLLEPFQNVKAVFSGHSTTTQKMGAAGMALGLAINGIKNWEKYDNNVSKIVVGTAVDTALDVALGAAGSAVGSVALGALGGAVAGPVGAVIGAKIGGFLGGMAGSWVSNQIKNSGVRDAIVDAGAGALDSAGQAISNTVQSAARGIDQLLRRSWRIW